MPFHLWHKPGLLALISDDIDFTMLFIIDIGAIQDLALAASFGGVGGLYQPDIPVLAGSALHFVSLAVEK
ncbi:MAG: hypothetical protein V7629_13250 [Motiliproteus sp.]